MSRGRGGWIHTYSPHCNPPLLPPTPSISTSTGRNRAPKMRITKSRKGIKRGCGEEKRPWGGVGGRKGVAEKQEGGGVVESGENSAQALGRGAVPSLLTPTSPFPPLPPLPLSPPFHPHPSFSEAPPTPHTPHPRPPEDFIPWPGGLQRGGGTALCGKFCPTH